jgi:hypothetical protein
VDASASVQLTLWPANYRARRGRRAVLTLGELAARCARPAVLADKRGAPGWAFSLGRDDRRRREDIEQLTAVVLDIDGAAPGSLERCGDALAAGGTVALLHTTHSHRAELERFRVIIALSRPVTLDEFAIIAPHAAAAVPVEVDPGSFDGTHNWRQPSHAAGAPYAWRAIDGAPLDVDALIASAPKDQRGHRMFGGGEPCSTTPLCPPFNPEPRRIDHVLALLHPATRRMIERGPTVSDFARRDEASGAWIPDRSRADFAVTMALVKAGASDEEIESVFLAYPEGIGARAREKSAGYVARTIAAVRRVAPYRRDARITDVRVTEFMGGSVRVSILLEPRDCDGGTAEWLAVVAPPRGNTMRWDALFAAADLDTPDLSDRADIEQQSFALLGAAVTLEIDPHPDRTHAVSRILPPPEADAERIA